MSHTPGPWKTGTSHPELERNVVCAGDVVVAHVVDDQHDNADANARLIAAAPELLQWIKECEHCLAYTWNPSATKRLVLHVRRIIAKAGSTPLEGP